MPSGQPPWAPRWQPGTAQPRCTAGSQEHRRGSHVGVDTTPPVLSRTRSTAASGCCACRSSSRCCRRRSRSGRASAVAAEVGVGDLIRPRAPQLGGRASNKHQLNTEPCAERTVMSVSLKPASSWRSGEPTGVRRGGRLVRTANDEREQAGQKHGDETPTQALRGCLGRESGRHPIANHAVFVATPVEPQRFSDVVAQV